MAVLARELNVIDPAIESKALSHAPAGDNCLTSQIAGPSSFVDQPLFAIGSDAGVSSRAYGDCRPKYPGPESWLADHGVGIRFRDIIQAFSEFAFDEIYWSPLYAVPVFGEVIGPAARAIVKQALRAGKSRAEVEQELREFRQVEKRVAERTAAAKGGGKVSPFAAGVADVVESAEAFRKSVHGLNKPAVTAALDPVITEFESLAFRVVSRDLNALAHEQIRIFELFRSQIGRLVRSGSLSKDPQTAASLSSFNQLFSKIGAHLEKEAHPLQSIVAAQEAEVQAMRPFASRAAEIGDDIGDLRTFVNGLNKPESIAPLHSIIAEYEALAFKVVTKGDSVTFLNELFRIAQKADDEISHLLRTGVLKTTDTATIELVDRFTQLTPKLQIHLTAEQNKIGSAERLRTSKPTTNDAGHPASPPEVQKAGVVGSFDPAGFRKHVKKFNNPELSAKLNPFLKELDSLAFRVVTNDTVEAFVAAEEKILKGAAERIVELEISGSISDKQSIGLIHRLAQHVAKLEDHLLSVEQKQLVEASRTLPRSVPQTTEAKMPEILVSRVSPHDAAINVRQQLRAPTAAQLWTTTPELLQRSLRLVDRYVEFARAAESAPDVDSLFKLVGPRGALVDEFKVVIRQLKLTNAAKQGETVAGPIMDGFQQLANSISKLVSDKILTFERKAHLKANKGDASKASKAVPIREELTEAHEQVMDELSSRTPRFWPNETLLIKSLQLNDYYGALADLALKKPADTQAILKYQQQLSAALDEVFSQITALDRGGSESRAIISAFQAFKGMVDKIIEGLA